MGCHEFLGTATKTLWMHRKKKKIELDAPSNEQIVKKDRHRCEHACEEQKKNNRQTLGVVLQEKKDPHDGGHERNARGRQAHDLFFAVLAPEKMCRHPKEECAEHGCLRLHIPRSEEGPPRDDNAHDDSRHEERTRFAGIETGGDRTNQCNGKECSECTCKEQVRRFVSPATDKIETREGTNGQNDGQRAVKVEAETKEAQRHQDIVPFLAYFCNIPLLPSASRNRLIRYTRDMQPLERFLSREHWLPLAFLLVLSYVTIIHGFSNPTALFWDENYHIASAQKYLNGVFFMEPHPPLGKLLIAAGEVILDRNAEDNQFITTDYATEPPHGFDFTGYRLFPVLFAWLTVPVLYGIFFVLTRRSLWSLLLTLLYVFDNALIVHARSAMLDSTMLFFCALTVFAFLLLLRSTDNKRLTDFGVLFGAAFACALATKAFALLFILLIPILLWKKRDDLGKLAQFSLAAALAFFVVYFGVWYLHFSLARTVVTELPDGGYYQSSDDARDIIDAGNTSSPLAFPTLLSDALEFVSHYEAGVPVLDLAKADENGSPWFLWPIGARTINYRWETPDGYSYRYLYLVPNPVVWGVALLSVLLGAIIFVAPYIVPGAQKSPLHFELGTFLFLYAAYLGAISRIDRVMYLYHYFLPLLFSFILVGIVVESLRNVGRWPVKEEQRTLGLLMLSVAIFLGYQVYRPFTYYEPLTDDQVTRRAIIKLWDLHCTECEASNVLATPTKP